MADSFFDNLDAAHEAYNRRHREAPFTDDVDPGAREPACTQCVQCREGLTHIATCAKGEG